MKSDSNELNMTKLNKKNPKPQDDPKTFVQGIPTAQNLVSGGSGAFLKSIDVTAENFLWGLDSSTLEFQKLAARVKQCKNGNVPQFLQTPSADADDCLTDLEHAVSQILTSYALARYGHQLENEARESIYRSLGRQTADENPDWLHENPVLHQLKFAELPLFLGLLFAEEKEAKTLVEHGKNNLSVGFEELLDSDGTPHSQWVSDTHLLLACWTRCLKYADAANIECLEPESQTQFEYFVRQSLRLTRKDKSLVFSSAAGFQSTDIILSALTCYHDSDDLNIANSLLRKSNQPKAKNKSPQEDLPDPSSNSEWAELAILQSKWLPKSPRLAVAYQNRKLIAELSCGHVLFSGELKHELLIDQAPISPSTDWEVVCWNDDRDGDFLELECELENGAKWQKHFFLARKDQFLLCGDSFLGLGKCEFDYSLNWAINHDIGFGSPQESTELFLTRKSKSIASIIPISLSEWSIGRSMGNVAINDGNFSFQTMVTGDNVYCPFFVDLKPSRCRKPLTWRQLTVAEQLKIVPSSVATGYRVQIGKQQWLIYRSFLENSSRTVLGQNLAVEFYVGTFNSNGTSDELISVD